MKAVLVFAVVAVAAATQTQYGHGGSSLGVVSGGGGYGSHSLGGGGGRGGGGGGRGGGGGGGYGSQVDLSFGYSDYHFSWRHDGGKKYDGESANYYCKSLGYGWQGVSIETPQEDAIISKIIYSDKVKYIWTSGFRTGYNWVWASNNPFYGINWSHTGSLGKPQPDNAENGKEYCLAVLNDFYKDGIKWHDVGCHHEKPIICERPRANSGYGGNSGGHGGVSGGHGGVSGGHGGVSGGYGSSVGYGATSGGYGGGYGGTSGGYGGTSGGYGGRYGGRGHY